MPTSASQLSPLTAARRQRTAAGRLAGLLFVTTPLVAAVAHGGLPDPDPGVSLRAPVLAAVLIGVTAVLLPWHRLAAAWLHLLPLAGALVIAVTVAGHGDHGVIFSPLFFVVATFAGYAFSGRGPVTAHVAVVAACLAAPLVYAPDVEPQLASRVGVALVALAATTALVVVLRERMQAGHEALRELAQSDPLTGVGNYRHLHARLTYEIARHKRSGRPLALLVLDLDGFKAVNDSLGHLAGDRLLKDVARALEDTVREQDTVARQGGDEFALLAPETGPTAAAALAVRVEAALREVAADKALVRASVGWAVYPADGEERMVLLERADARQRAAKRARQASERSVGTRLSA